VGLSGFYCVPCYRVLPLAPWEPNSVSIVAYKQSWVTRCVMSILTSWCHDLSKLTECDKDSGLDLNGISLTPDLRRVHHICLRRS